MFLDTRTKIVPLDGIEEQLQGREATWITGHFDPLLSEHVRRLTKTLEPGRLLVVEVANPAQPLLGQRARAELVAALSVVDFVVMGDGDGAMDAEITRRFIEHVLIRHNRESAR